MSLPSPISIGDAIALSNIAWNIAKEFIPGAKNAEDDFKELHGLLCSLTNTLQLVGKHETFRHNDKATESRDTTDAPQNCDNTVVIITRILSHCNNILSDLQRLVKRYSTLEQQPGSSSNKAPAPGRSWPDSVRRKWMEVLWVAESDNISVLKQSLTAHIQNLNLAIATMNSERLGEMFEWLKANLKSQDQSQSVSVGSLADKTGDLGLVAETFSFKVFREDQPGDDRMEKLLCPNAALASPPPFPAYSASSMSGCVFDCLCPGHRHACTAYTLSPISTFVKVIGGGVHLVWQIYLQEPASGRLVSVLVRGLVPKYIAKFERWSDQLSLFQAMRPENADVRNTFISSGLNTVSVLHMKSDASKYARKLLSVSVMTGGKCLTLGRMSSLQILHHRILAKVSGPAPHGAKYQSRQLLPQRCITLVMHSDSTVESEAGKEYMVRVQCNTRFSSPSSTDMPRFIAIHDVLCTEGDSGSSAPRNPIASCHVTLEFANSTLAENLESDLKDATHLLRHQYVTGQRWGEESMIQRNLPGDCFIKHVVLSEAIFKLIVDSESGVFRIVLLRGDHTAAVCFDLPSELLQESLVRNANVTSNSRPAWFMNIDESRIRIKRQESGIDPLSMFSKRNRPSLMLEDYEDRKGSDASDMGRYST